MKMKQLAALVLGVGLLALAGCATVSTGYEGTGNLPEQPIGAPPPPPPSDDATGDEAAPPPPPPPPSQVLLTPALPWENGDPERAAWSAELRAQVANNLTSLSKASDIQSYCPAFAKLGSDDKVEVLSTLFVGVAGYESGYDPHHIYHEPAPLNIDSVGLFQLSYEDGFTWCAIDRNARSLEDPINNIRCAVPKMTRLVAKDHVLAAGSTSANALGLARYWSVMRLGHHIDDIRRMTLNMAMCRR